MNRKTYSVGDVARIARVTVRTLHHYDAIGLLSPCRRRDSGYREYGQAELERLQTIRVYRSTGMSLEEIKAALKAPNYDRAETLLNLRNRLRRDIERSEHILATIDRTLADIENTETHGAQSMLTQGLFDGFDAEAFADEAEAQWGNTDQWAESKRRTKAYGALEMATIKDEARAINATLASLLQEGAPPQSVAAMDVAEDHRQHIRRWFYECTPAMHVATATLYTEDHRFRDHYESVTAGLAAFARAAVEANAKRSLADL